MHRQDRGLERAERLHRLADGVRDIVELEVEEHRQAEIGHFANAVATVGGEEFKPELDPADMMANAQRDRLGAIEIGRIQRDIDPARHFQAAPGDGTSAVVPERMTGSIGVVAIGAG